MAQEIPALADMGIWDGAAWLILGVLIAEINNKSRIHCFCMIFRNSGFILDFAVGFSSSCVGFVSGLHRFLLGLCRIDVAFVPV